MCSIEIRQIPGGRALEICIFPESSIGEKRIVTKSYARKIGINTEGCAVKRCYVFEGRKREYCSIAEICTAEVRFICPKVLLRPKKKARPGWNAFKPQFDFTVSGRSPLTFREIGSVAKLKPFKIDLIPWCLRKIGSLKGDVLRLYLLGRAAKCFRRPCPAWRGCERRLDLCSGHSYDRVDHLPVAHRPYPPCGMSQVVASKVVRTYGL